MSYTQQSASRPDWSALVEGLVGLIQLATSAASARLLQEPGTREFLARGYVVSYIGDDTVAARAAAQFKSRMDEISGSYDCLRTSLERLQQHANFTAKDVQDMTWEKARDMHAPRDCLVVDEIRGEIETCLCQCAIAHAQIVSSVTTIIENIRHSYICRPQDLACMGPPASAGEPQPQEEPEEQQPKGSDEQQVRRRGRQRQS